MNELHEQLHAINEKLDTIHKHLFVGNGRPSLMERVRIVEDRHDHCPAREHMAKRLDRMSLAVAIAAVAVSIWSIFK